MEWKNSEEWISMNEEQGYGSGTNTYLAQEYKPQLFHSIKLMIFIRSIKASC